jgi:hypothetical protein
MWFEALKSAVAQNPLESKFFSGTISFRGTAAGIQRDPTGNIDAVLAIRASHRQPPTRLIIVHPDATAAKARQSLLGLAFSQILHHSVQPRLRDRLQGIVFVTQQIVLTRELLSGVRVRNQSIAEVFKILPLGGGTPTLEWNTLLVANPGRVLQRRKDINQIRALVIDASHPRTLLQLPTLLAQAASDQYPLQVILAPASDHLLKKEFRGQIWLWDPEAANTATSSHDHRSVRSGEASERHYWESKDSVFDTVLTRTEELLVGAFRLNQEEPKLHLTEAWSILTCLRGLCVPLEQAERAWRESRFGNRLRDRIESLGRSVPSASGDLKTYLAVHWNQVLTNLNEGYSILAKRGEPEKFFTLAGAVEEFLAGAQQTFRIVTVSQEEAPILGTALSDLNDRIRLALADGDLEVVHQREEARRIAEGRYAPTLLSSARAPRYRYLDVFPVHPTHLVCYPTELLQDRSRVERQHKAWEPFRSDAWHCQIAGLPSSPSLTIPQKKPWQIDVILHGSPKAEKSQWELDESSLELDWIPGESPLEGLLTVASNESDIALDTIIIEDVNGEKLSFGEAQLLNIYRPETGKLLRVLGSHVHQGDHLVLLLDDHLEGLFDRLVLAMDDRRPLEDTLRLERWRAAKDRLYTRFNGDRRAIFRKLAPRVSVNYDAAKAWFQRDSSEDVECIGPLTKQDFAHLAELTSAYRDAADIAATYQTVHTERVNRRRLGRALHASLKSVAGGSGFDQAMRTAQALDTEVEEVISCVEMREIARVISNCGNDEES